MVKKVVTYKCEICGKAYIFKSDAVECEDKGSPELYPIGMIFSMSFVENAVFAIIKQFPNAYGHRHAYSTWGCRDTPAGDNCEGDKYCGLQSWDKINPPNKTLDAYNRMIEALKKDGIEPSDYERSERYDKMCM